MDLPASKKTRALLAYLVVSGSRRSRSELCDLLWENVEDPRAALRWSLSKLRQVIGEEAVTADRNYIEANLGYIATDITVIEALAEAGLAGADLDALIEAASTFRGEFLDDLDMPGCYRYYEWCNAERERVGQIQKSVLKTLVDRLSDSPEQALIHARALIRRNPFDEHAHIRVMDLLAVLGRRSEALAQYDQCMRIFERELGVEPSVALEAALRDLPAPRPDRTVAVAQPTDDAALEEITVRHPSGFVGRAHEIQQIVKAFQAKGSEILLISGPPGIGKSTLVDEALRRFEGLVIKGRAYEAEMIRPFGLWVDALRDIDKRLLPKEVAAPLAPLIASGENLDVALHRDRLFEAVKTALVHLARLKPIALIVDDLQWIDESSAALLHFVIRSLSLENILFCLTVRPGEFEDNAAAQAVVSGQAEKLRRIALAPLSSEEAAELVNSVVPDAVSTDIVNQAQGNPLYLIELARMLDASGPAETLKDILNARLARVSQGAGNLLSWASAFGRTVPLDALVETSGIAFGQAISLLAELERHDLIRSLDEEAYEFSHDLIQNAAYGRISQPRRRLMHRNIAHHFGLEMQYKPEVAVYALLHASRADQHPHAARAALIAGEHSIKVFAGFEAIEFARHGLHHTAYIQDKPENIRLRIALLRVQVLAASGPLLTKLPDLSDELEKAIENASTLYLNEEVAQGYYLLSVLHQETGDHESAQQATKMAAKASEQANQSLQVRQLANTARCLTELGRDIPRARELLQKAQALASSAALEDVEIFWGRGLLANWDGDLDEAARDIERAVMHARDAEDRWRECKCLTWLAMIELEQGNFENATAWASELNAIAEKLGEGASAPLAQAIIALASENADDRDRAIENLRQADDKSHLAYILNLAARQQLMRGNISESRWIAQNALSVALEIKEPNEVLLAQATLVQTSLGQKSSGNIACDIAAMKHILKNPDGLRTRTLGAINAALDQHAKEIAE